MPGWSYSLLLFPIYEARTGANPFTPEGGLIGFPATAPLGGTISNLFTISIAFLTFKVSGLKLGWM